MHYIATFHTHLGAMTFKNRLQAMGDTEAVMMPVPRALSSSCGTCVFEKALVSPAAYLRLYRCYLRVRVHVIE